MARPRLPRAAVPLSLSERLNPMTHPSYKLPAPEGCVTVREGRILAVLTSEGRLVALGFCHEARGEDDTRMSVVMATGEEVEV
jgi:hypothetical protein